MINKQTALSTFLLLLLTVQGSRISRNHAYVTVEGASEERKQEEVDPDTKSLKFDLVRSVFVHANNTPTTCQQRAQPDTF